MTPAIALLRARAFRFASASGVKRSSRFRATRKATSRTAELRVRLPRHQVAMLEYRAEQWETTVSGVLARELDGVAGAHAEELSAVIPGFAAAMVWPEAELAVC
jgi:TPP-dependent indolepyruvate ferredoxin oxidoreductase alpha subunit